MKQTKHILATIAMLLCSLAASAEDFEVGGIYYNITSEEGLTVEVTYQGSYSSEYNEYSEAVIIPATVTHNGVAYSVTSIGNDAFYGCSSLTSITIPESVTSIGEYTFQGCSSLASITLPEGVTSIGVQAFSYCSSLTAITIPESVTSIGGWAFYSCSSLAAITLPEGVTSIGDGAFRGCSSLTAVHISSLTAWCKISFSTSDSNPLFYAHNLYINGELVTELVIPHGVTSIGDAAFYYCSSLTSIILPESVTSIGGGAFSGCSSLTSITIPESVTSIGDFAFSGCSSLTAITLPEGVTSIGERAFLGCTGLTSIILPEGVTSIGYGTFCNCSSLTDITIPENSKLTSIGDDAFWDCESLTSITIPESVTSIGYYAFEGCSSLERVTINCANVGDWFSGYSSIKEIVLGEGVTSIGNYAFDGCSSLTTITIPESVTSIGRSAFENCTSLTSAHTCDLEAWCNIDFEDSSANPLCYAKDLYINGELVTELVIPNSVTAIKNYAFSGCSGLTTITLPEGVTSIGEGAFEYCSSLTAITLPDGVTSIGGSAFYNCANLCKVFNNSSLSLSKGSSSNGYVAYYAKVIYQGCKPTTIGDFQFYTSEGIHSLVNYIGNDTEVVLPDSYNGESYEIGIAAFRDCDGLTVINIPEGVTSIGDYAFSNCDGLTSVVIPKGVTSIGNYAFDGCSRLTAITLPDGVTSIGYYAFRECSRLIAISIPENSQLTSIGDYAFQDCSSLTSITLPASVTSIGYDIGRSCGVFSKCTSLKEVIFEDGTETLAVGCDYFSNSPRRPGRGLFYDCPLEKVYLGRNLNYDTRSKAGYSPFYDKGTLTSLTIGPEVTEIGANAFSGCSAIDTIHCHAVVPPICYGASTFTGVDTSIPVYVPEGSVADYQAAEVWKDFFNFVGADLTGIDNLEPTDNGEQQAVIYDLMGRRVANPTKGGIYIVNGRKVVVK